MDAKAYKFGVEIECTLPYHNLDLCQSKLRDLKCVVTGDESITPREPGHEGYEIITEPLGYNDMFRTLSKVCRILDENGVHGNSSCGLHVHTSHRKFRVTKYLKRVIIVWLAIEDVMFATQPDSRYRNTYCIRLLRSYVNGEFDDMPANKEKLIGKVSGRYYALNIKNLSNSGIGTIECRLHSWSADHIKIRHWITLLRAMYSYALDRYDRDEVKALFEMPVGQEKIDKTWELLKLDERVRSFYNARINRNMFSNLKVQQGKAVEYEKMINVKKKVLKKYEKANKELTDFRDSQDSITSAFS